MRCPLFPHLGLKREIKILTSMNYRYVCYFKPYEKWISLLSTRKYKINHFQIPNPQILETKTCPSLFLCYSIFHVEQKSPDSGGDTSLKIATLKLEGNKRCITINPRETSCGNEWWRLKCLTIRWGMSPIIYTGCNRGGCSDAQKKVTKWNLV